MQYNCKLKCVSIKVTIDFSSLECTRAEIMRSLMEYITLPALETIGYRCRISIRMRLKVHIY